MAKRRAPKFSASQFFRSRRARSPEWAIVSAANAARARSLHDPDRVLVVPGAPSVIWEVIDASDEPALDEECARSKHAQMTRQWPV